MGGKYLYLFQLTPSEGIGYSSKLHSSNLTYSEACSSVVSSPVVILGGWNCSWGRKKKNRGLVLRDGGSDASNRRLQKPLWSAGLSDEVSPQRKLKALRDRAPKTQECSTTISHPPSLKLWALSQRAMCQSWGCCQGGRKVHKRKSYSSKTFLSLLPAPPIAPVH